MFRNLAVIILVLAWGALAATWLVHAVWVTRVGGVDSGVTTIVSERVGLYFVLSSRKTLWFLAFLAASVTQTLIAIRLFSG